MSTKESVGFFLFCLDLELFSKIKKDLVSTHSLFTLLLITQDLSICRHYYVENVCKVSARDIKLYGSWSSLVFRFSVFQTKGLVGFLDPHIVIFSLAAFDLVYVFQKKIFSLLVIYIFFFLFLGL